MLDTGPEGQNSLMPFIPALCQGVTALQVQGPRSTRQKRRDQASAALHKTPAHVSLQHSSPNPQPEAPHAHHEQPGLLPLPAFIAAPTGHCLPGRLAALSEISILGCGKVSLRQARRDPC